MNDTNELRFFPLFQVGEVEYSPSCNDLRTRDQIGWLRSGVLVVFLRFTCFVVLNLMVDDNVALSKPGSSELQANVVTLSDLAPGFAKD
jgi:hypothetical protein